MPDELFFGYQVRPDQAVIAEHLEPGSRVLDLGCGDGSFLAYLRELKGIRGMGIEISQSKIAECIAHGVPVIQGNLDAPLTFADDDSFDCVVLSHTLQETRNPDLLLREIARVGRKAVISFLNFGHLSCRLQLLLHGRMPVTGSMPYSWYSTPNIHLGTLKDFRELCAKLQLEILRETPIVHDFSGLANLWPNLFAPSCVFELASGADNHS